MDTNELIGRIVGRIIGGLLSATIGLITWQRITETMVIAAVGALVSGVVGFFITMTLQRIFLKKDRTNK